MEAQKYNFTVDKRREGKRLDTYLADKLNRKISRTFIKKMVDDGYVLVNGKSVKAHYAVNDGDAICLDIPEPEPVDIRPEKIDLDILYEDSDVIVLNKPAGLVVHPGAGNPSGTLVNGLVYHSSGLSGVGSCPRPGIVHRLDKDTSGVLVVAKNDYAHRFLSEQFKKHSTKRTYVALVKGVVQLDNGTIELPLGRHALERKKISIKYADGKEAKTHYTVLERFGDFTVLELRLETGRTHQIRVHMAHTGHPLIGDRVYGSPKGMKRQALHAKTLGFIHPTTNKFMEFDTEIPIDMKEVIQRGRL